MNGRRVLSMAVLTLAVVMAGAWGQYPRARLYSRPGLPSAEMLRKLDLRLAWATTVPMDGRRDAFIRVMIDGPDFIVLTRSGQIALYNAEDGKLVWKVRPARAYTAAPYLAANSHSIYTVANATLYGIHRGTGSIRWEYPLPAGLAVGPVVDERNIYVPRSDGRVSAFRLPPPGAEKEVVGRVGSRFAYGSVVAEPALLNRPVGRWHEDTTLELSYRPLVTPVAMMVVSFTGKAKGYSLPPPREGSPINTFRFSADGKIRAEPGQYGEMAYIGSEDDHVYALNFENGNLLWRYTAGTAFTRKPIALEQDIYVTSEREGMARLERETGKPLWRIPVGRDVLLGNNTKADRFLAASERFVYALDGSNHLLILDRKRGVTLTTVDITAFRYPIVNEVTDRLYLAANDGLLLCLHDRELSTPLRHRERLEMEWKLEKVVDVVKTGPMKLDTALATLRKEHGLDYEYRRAALKAAGLGDIEKRNVAFKEMFDAPLREVYKDVLGQVNAEVVVGRRTLEIVPTKKEKGPPPKEEGPEKAKDKEKDV